MDLLEVNCFCPPVIGEIYNLTCSPLVGVYLPSRYSASVSGWMMPPLTQHSSKSIFSPNITAIFKVVPSPACSHFLSYSVKYLSLFSIPFSLHWQLIGTSLTLQ